ncbi:hypothetical protein CVT26_000698 [Gymnopilus dilepis]|uniref:Uncharacterized protein n=1 Tax=Gymnopilus dilepis TaxID=231916 RepID=A0A409WB95_9AGAR|nr:hypothetical protein CVT26_000698 [Gymnopilus dilepis]
MAPSCSITRAIDKYVGDLVNIPVDQPLDTAFGDALEAEKGVRLLFRSDCYNPLLLNPYICLIDIFNVPLAARRTRARRIEPHTTDIYDHHVFPLPSSRRRLSLMASTVSDIEAFQARWKIFTHDALSKMKAEDWENVIAAGGSVLACLMEPRPALDSLSDLSEYFQSEIYAASDIDLFLWGLSPKQAEKKMIDIYHAVRAAMPSHVTCVRKANTISIHTEWPQRPIQIILRLYQSPAEILVEFDVDAACCAYDGKRVWVNSRSLTALVRQSNIIDVSRRSPSYEARLLKYAKRGFEVYIPSLRRASVKLSIYSNDGVSGQQGLARLLALEAANYGPPLVAEDHEHFDANNYDTPFKIPYGKSWTAEKIENMIRERVNYYTMSAFSPVLTCSQDAWMNCKPIKDCWTEGQHKPAHFNMLNEGISNYHRHVFFAGTMEQCLAYFCQACAIIEDMGLVLASFNSRMYISGPVK